MPAYNAEKYIGEAIESVMYQSYNNWKLIIVNDGSTDTTFNIIKHYQSLSPEKICYLEHKQNHGTVAAINTALRNAVGDYLCWLSADDVYKEHMFHSSLNFLEDHSEFDAVFSRCEYIDSNSKHCGNWKANQLIFELKQKNSTQPYKKLITESNVFYGCSLMGRIEVFRKTGFFSSQYRYAHDYEYWLRLSSKFNIGYIDEVNVQGRVHKGQVSNEGLNDIDAIRVFFDFFLNNRCSFNSLCRKANLAPDIEGLVSCIRGRLRIYSSNSQELNEIAYQIQENLLEKKLLSTEKRLLVESNILDIAQLIINNPTFKNPYFFQEQVEENYLFWLSKFLQLDGFVINKMGIRFDKYNEGNDIKRLCKGLERDNNIFVIEIETKQLYEFIDRHKGNVKYHVDTLLANSILKIGISEYMMNDSSFNSNLPMKNATRFNITIWQAFFDLILLHKNTLLS